MPLKVASQDMGVKARTAVCSLVMENLESRQRGSRLSWGNKETPQALSEKRKKTA